MWDPESDDDRRSLRGTGGTAECVLASAGFEQRTEEV